MIKVIKTKKEYKKALKRIEKIWEAKIGTKKGDELELLSVLVEKYEFDNFLISKPDPVEAIKFRMEQLGMSRKDLAVAIGANRVSEVFQKKRNLSIGMIKILRKELKMSADILLG